LAPVSTQNQPLAASAMHWPAEQVLCGGQSPGALQLFTQRPAWHVNGEAHEHPPPQVVEAPPQPWPPSACL
jgi:hypothetical protein